MLRIHFNARIQKIAGWQRYDHFAVLCELLPVGIPALAMSLRLLQGKQICRKKPPKTEFSFDLGYQDSALGPPLEVAKLLQCDQPYGLMGTALGTPKCKFPGKIFTFLTGNVSRLKIAFSGGDILEYIIHFHQLDQEFSELLENPQVKGWLSHYNTVNNFSNPAIVKSALISIDEIKVELEVVKEQISRSMLKIYYKHTVLEWLATYLEPVEKKVLNLKPFESKLKKYFAGFRSVGSKAHNFGEDCLASRANNRFTVEHVIYEFF